jgi:hypothetical protein
MRLTWGIAVGIVVDVIGVAAFVLMVVEWVGH